MSFFVVSSMCITLASSVGPLCSPPKTLRAEEYPDKATCSVWADAHREALKIAVKPGSKYPDGVVASSTVDVECLSTRDTILKLESHLKPLGER